jgi:hypothetical protein
MLGVIATAVLLILGTPVPNPGAGWRRRSAPFVLLIAPAALAYLLVVMAWRSANDGQCGGWLGETQPCLGFGQYAREALYWAALSMGLPALLGLFLGIAVLLLRLLRRGIGISIAVDRVSTPVPCLASTGWSGDPTTALRRP